MSQSRARYFLPLILVFLITACKRDDQENQDPPGPVGIGEIDYRHEMRQFVVHLSQYARQFDGDFIVIPQNGQQLCSVNGEPDGELAIDYMATINGQGREELFYGFDNNDDDATPQEERDLLQPYLERMRDAGVRVMITDYCTTPAKVDDSYDQNEALDFLSFAADTRDLYTIPTYPLPILHENDEVITTLQQAQNFLYIINTQDYPDKQSFINAVASTNYDLVLMDAFFEDEPYTAEEINQVRQKANGGQRLVISYMSIGEAEDYRYYWQPYWSFNAPDWVGTLNPDWPGNYEVEYWNEEWQSIIYGNDDSYVRRIVDSGFDGVYLDIIDAFEIWEEQ